MIYFILISMKFMTSNMELIKIDRHYRGKYYIIDCIICYFIMSCVTMMLTINSEQNGCPPHMED